MMPSSLKSLIDILKSLPGVGEKTAERLSYSIMDFDFEKIKSFSDILIDLKENIFICNVCGCICDNEICSICSNVNRKKNSILVVERSKDVFMFEKFSFFKGTYHVLNALISPLKGIEPDDINVSSLLERVMSNDACEIIFALKPGIESEITIQYIKKLLPSSIDVKTSKLATGVPMGTDIEYIDSMTLETALEDRKFFE